MNPHPRRSPSPRRTGLRRVAGDESGWVLIPVIALLAVALGLGLALLLLVDNQTKASSQQRDMDAAQTLAEGVLTSTATVLATSSDTATDWTTSGCQTVIGTLVGGPTPSTDLSVRVQAEVRKYFSDVSSSDAAKLTTYGRSGRGADWTAYVCPTLDPAADHRFETPVLQRTGATGRTANGQKTLWVQAQANIRGAKTTGPETKPPPLRSRSVAAKVQQGGTAFVPPQDVIDTASFSTDLTVASGSPLTGGLLGGVTGAVLGNGPTPLVAESTAPIGVRCGLLDALKLDPLKPLDEIAKLQLCLTGTLVGVTQILDGTGLGAVNRLLGVENRFRSLAGWTVAPPRAVDAYRDAAQRGGIYVKGTGNVAAGEAGNSNNHPCLEPDEVTTKETVVFIEKVGNNGEQYCTLQGDRTARILVIARGGVRVIGTFRGVIYALNLQECGEDDTVCSTLERKNAPKRELVQVERPGQVIGAIWADGAGGQVGIYPGAMTLDTAAVSTAATTPQLCSSGGLLYNVLGGVTNLLNVVGGLLGALLGDYQYRALAGSGATACKTLQVNLANITNPTTLLNLLQGGPLVLQVNQRLRCVTKVVVCLKWSDTWENYTGASGGGPAGTATVTLPNLLAPGGVLGATSNLLSGSLGNYTAVQRDLDAIARAGILLPSNATVVPGTYRNVPVVAGT